jgi:hypothetical protein
VGEDARHAKKLKRNMALSRAGLAL